MWPKSNRVIAVAGASHHTGSWFVFGRHSAGHNGGSNMNRRTVTATALIVSFFFAQASYAAEPVLIAIGSVSGLYEDFATQTAGLLGNNVPGNRLGGIGSGLTYLGGDWFLALPDRGPNAVSCNACMDDTVSYINRFHTFHLSLSPSDPGSTFPFTLTPMLIATTLLSSRSPLVYGAGCGVAGSGAPALNAIDHTHYFTGRSDNFDPTSRRPDTRCLSATTTTFSPRSRRRSALVTTRTSSSCSRSPTQTSPFFEPQHFHKADEDDHDGDHDGHRGGHDGHRW
jgi:hypothetical protein